MPASRNLIQNVITATLVLCAVLVTITVVHREFFTPAPTPSANRLKPVAQWEKLVVGRSADIGKNSAPTKLILFSDYQCPFCKELDGNLRKLVHDRAGAVSVYRYELPLKNVHPQAYLAAVAAKCGAEQGIRGPLQAKLFDHGAAMTRQDISTLSRESGVTDALKFSACLDSERAKGMVDRDVAAAESLGFHKVPILVVNGVPFEGSVGIDALERMIADTEHP